MKSSSAGVSHIVYSRTSSTLYTGGIDTEWNEELSTSGVMVTLKAPCKYKSHSEHTYTVLCTMEQNEMLADSQNESIANSQ